MNIEEKTFPYIDKRGWMWLDSITAITADRSSGPCFMCKKLTYKLDICFEAFFCGSWLCSELITEDLRSERLYESESINSWLFGIKTNAEKYFESLGWE